MTRAWLYRLVAAALSLSAGACATCVPYQIVGVQSTPERAQIFLDGELVGETPMRLPLGTQTDHSVFLKKEGFRSELVVLSVNRPGDGINFLTPPDVHVRLVPLTGPPERDLEVEVEEPSEPAKTE